jgi:hypothetical protein
MTPLPNPTATPTCRDCRIDGGIRTIGRQSYGRTRRVVFQWTIDRTKTGENKQRSADLDELGVKIDDAIASRKAKVQARKHERERWIHLLEQKAAEGRRKRRERHTAELPTGSSKPAAQYGA